MDEQRIKHKKYAQQKVINPRGMLSKRDHRVSKNQFTTRRV
jgi:hypothetical protein